MVDVTKETEKGILHFYLAPELRSVATIFYFGIFGYFTIYYLDNLFLTVRFLSYIIFSHTALEGIGYLFSGMVFVISLLLPFAVSLYSIFVLPKIWRRGHWSVYAKSVMTAVVIAGGILIIILSEDIAHLAARQPSMQNFMEDANLTGRI